MKKTLTITSLVAIICICGVVIAMNLAPYEDDGYVSSRERAIIRKFDKDGDGQLNPLEQREADAAIRAAEAREKAAWIQKLDQNGDGKVSSEEKQNAEREAAARKQKLIERFDTDGDGKLSREEGMAARKAMK